MVGLWLLLLLVLLLAGPAGPPWRRRAPLRWAAAAANAVEQQQPKLNEAAALAKLQAAAELQRQRHLDQVKGEHTRKSDILGRIVLLHFSHLARVHPTAACALTAKAGGCALSGGPPVLSGQRGRPAHAGHGPVRV